LPHQVKPQGATNPNHGVSGLIGTVTTISRWIRIKLAARTMAGLQINEVAAPTKILLRVISRPSKSGITALQGYGY
jgi:hypothetical protein